MMTQAVAVVTMKMVMSTQKLMKMILMAQTMKRANIQSKTKWAMMELSTSLKVSPDLMRVINIIEEVKDLVLEANNIITITDKIAIILHKVR